MPKPCSSLPDSNLSPGLTRYDIHNCTWHVDAAAQIQDRDVVAARCLTSYCVRGLRSYALDFTCSSIVHYLYPHITVFLSQSTTRDLLIEYFSSSKSVTKYAFTTLIHIH